MISKKLMAIVAATIMALGGVVASVSPASATATDKGVVAATGWVHLPCFGSGVEAPNAACPDPSGNAFVTAKFCVNGVYDAPPPIVYDDGVANPTPPGPTACVGGTTPTAPSLTAKFTYLEPCPVPAVGFAEGSLSLAGQPNPNPIEYFSWVRVGLTAVLQISDVGPPPLVDPQALPGADGSAVAIFAPAGAPGVACPGGPIDAYVAAVGAFN